MSTKKVWIECMEKILESGREYVDNSNRKRKEISNFVIMLDKKSLKDIDAPVNILSSSNKWLYPTKKEIASIMFKDINMPLYDYTYGDRIFNFLNKINQINDYVIPLLRKHPDTRRAFVSLANPVYDAKFKEKNTPSILLIQFRIINSCLEVTFYIRSCDFFFGWPANIYQIHLLQQHVAEKLKIKQGSITTIANSAHLFTSNLEDIKEALNKK